MTATAVLTRCPAWCTEHVEDLDGSFLGHAHKVLTPLEGTWVYLHKYEDEQFIDVQVQDLDHGFSPENVVQLIDVLVRAVWMLDPDFEYAADHDTDGLWAAIGKTVRQVFADAGANQFDAAMLLGITQPDFSIISRGMGVRTFTLRELAAVADFAGITLTELISDIERNRR